MFARLLSVVCSLFLVATVASVAGCSKKDEKDKDKSSKTVTKPKGDKAGATTTAAAAGPSKADVGKLDCEKVCAQQMECYKNAAVKVTDQMKKMCSDGCSMTKSMYDPAKHAKVAAQLLKYQAGKCE